MSIPATIERCPHDRENPYAQINRQLIRDSSISWTCMGMLVYLLSMKDGWVISVSQLCNHMQKHFGRDKVYSILQEAIEAGYVRKESFRDPDKKTFKGIKYFLSETPKFKKPFPENPLQTAKIPDSFSSENNNNQSHSYEEPFPENPEEPFPEKPFPEKPFPANPTLRNNISLPLSNHEYKERMEGGAPSGGGCTATPVPSPIRGALPPLGPPAPPASPAVIPSSSSKRKKEKEQLEEVDERVFLTPSQQKAALKRCKGDHQLFKACCQKLSDWKLKKGISGGSDYLCMTKWVIEATLQEVTHFGSTMGTEQRNVRILENLKKAFGYHDDLQFCDEGIIFASGPHWKEIKCCDAFFPSKVEQELKRKGLIE